MVSAKERKSEGITAESELPQPSRTWNPWTLGDSGGRIGNFTTRIQHYQTLIVLYSRVKAKVVRSAWASITVQGSRGPLITRGVPGVFITDLTAPG